MYYMYKQSKAKGKSTSWTVVEGGRDTWLHISVERPFLLQCDTLMRKPLGKGSEAKKEVISAFYMSNESGASVVSMNHKPNKQSAVYIKKNE